MSEVWEEGVVGERRYTALSPRETDPSTSDLHAWSIYRQNLNSDFTDSALGADERSPLPYGNFQLREQTVSSILQNPRLGPRSEIHGNSGAYLKFGLPRVVPPHRGNLSGQRTPEERGRKIHHPPRPRSETDLRPRSEIDLRDGVMENRFRRNRQLRASSEGNLLQHAPNRVSRDEDRWRHHTQNETREPLPHLQVRHLCVEENNKFLIQDLSLDLRGGEMVAIMATNAKEGSALLETLGGNPPPKTRLSGEIVYNGNKISLGRLGKRTALVTRKQRLLPHLTPRQTLYLHKAFRKPKDSQGKDTVDGVLEEMGLGSVKDSAVDSLTHAEKQRLLLATQIILETEILLLDDPTKDTDIFDTFFLVSLLESWTKKGEKGRITAMTIHPPTFEIFLAFERVSLISSGRTIFWGERAELLPYFSFIDYPCPPFKNPSDYYIDLVTLDDLSPEALLESSQRIQSLAEAWRRREEVLREPGPPLPLPPPILRPSPPFLAEVLLLAKWWFLGGFWWGFLGWASLFFLGGFLSIFLGGVYWDVRSGNHVTSVYDRLGLIWSLLTILPPPLLLLLGAIDQSEKETQEELYSRAAHFTAKILVESILLLVLFLCYIVPLDLMGGGGEREILLFGGYSLLCLVGMRCCVLGVEYIWDSPLHGLSLGGVIYLVGLLTGGYSLHVKDIGSWVRWTGYLSPIHWLFGPLARAELPPKTTFTLCQNPIVHLQGNILMRELSCGLPNGEAVLAHFQLQRMQPTFLPLLATSAISLVALLTALMAFILKRRRLERPQKP